MRMQTKLPIVTLIGAGALLLVALAVIFTLPRAALAQDAQRVSVSVGDHSLHQGEKTYIVAQFYNLPRDSGDTGFADLSYRFHVERNSEGDWTKADSCGMSLVGADNDIDTWYRSPLQVGGADNFSISSTCPVGNYRIRVSVKNNTTNTEVVSGTQEITVSLGPSVTIEMPSGPYNRGSSFDATIEFNDLSQGANYTYEANLMARNPSNFADICEGTGLARNNTFSLNGVSGNPVEKTVTITDTCPKNEYALHVTLKDSDNRKRGSKDVNFEIVTD